MLRRPVNLAATLALVVLIAAVLGFLAESLTHRPAAPPANDAAIAQDMVLNFPRTWKRVATGPSVPGLALSNVVRLAPRGHGDRAGLIAGRAPAEGPTPLPADLLARLAGPPRGDVVALGGLEMYRYTGLHVPGSDAGLTLYAVPSAGDVAIIACVAAAGSTSYLDACGNIAAGTDPLRTAPFTLLPNEAYARGLSSVLARLDAVRGAAPKAVRTLPSAQEAALANRLSAAYAVAARYLAAGSPPQAAGHANGALAAAFRRAGSAYSGVAAAARALDAAAVSQWSSAARAAEGQVRTAIAALGSLGYAAD
ncbi:MAG: eukaryotic-like serine/threonine-protein kinase [Solirubrobacteraceae bacterium]|nr:eukaryotic-like serine/threonine-protein kinase [Solirubrobacteraceae bacterium]